MYHIYAGSKARDAVGAALAAEEFALPVSAGRQGAIRPESDRTNVLLEAIPAGIRREPAAEFLRQRAQGRDYVLEPASTRIVQRAAAKRRITGAEDHRAVDDVGIVDDALAQARDTDVRHRQDQPVDHFRRRPRRGRRA